MAKPHKKKGGKGGKPVRHAAMAPAVDAQLLEVAQGLRMLAEESPEGWGMIAEIVRDTEEIEADIMLEYLARHLGKEVLPLLRGAALDEDEEFALGALHALPL